MSEAFVCSARAAPIRHRIYRPGAPHPGTRGGGPGPTLWNPGRGGPLKPPPPIVNGEPDHQYEDCEGMERKHAAKITTYNKNIKKNANIKKKKK